MKKKSLKKTVAVMLSGVCLASGVAVPADTVQASAGLGYWPENLPIPNQYYYQKESGCSHMEPVCDRRTEELESR